MITIGRALSVFPAVAGTAALVAILPLSWPKEDDLALAAAKRLHAELTGRGVHIVEASEWAPAPTSQWYVCRPTDEFDLDEAVRSLVDMVLASGRRTVGFYEHQTSVRMTEAHYEGVFVCAHCFIDSNTGRRCTMLQVWVA